MNEHLIHDFQHATTFLWLVLTVVLIATIAYSMRSPKSNPIAKATAVNPAHVSRHHETSLPLGSSSIVAARPRLHDTIFILPDISNYTRFISSDQISPQQCQEIVFALMNAMIDAASKTLELSKIEGDAALFFADSNALTDADMGNTIMAIFKAFFDERHRLINQYSRSPKVGVQIKELDLKVFVHKGMATRFNFKGSTDHFGAAVTILHKLLKNGTDSDRYVMVTEAASDSVSLPDWLVKQSADQDLDHVGSVRTSIYSFPGAVKPPTNKASKTTASKPAATLLGKTV